VVVDAGVSVDPDAEPAGLALELPHPAARTASPARTRCRAFIT
jgi:hypothetical protein